MTAASEAFTHAVDDAMSYNNHLSSSDIVRESSYIVSVMDKVDENRTRLKNVSPHALVCDPPARRTGADGSRPRPTRCFSSGS